MALDLGCYKSETKKSPKPLKYPRSILESHKENTNMEQSGATLSHGAVFSEGCPVQGSPLRGHCSIQTGLSHKPFELQRNTTIPSQVQESRLEERRENMCMKTVPDRKGIWRKTACSRLAKPFKPYFYIELLASSTE